MAYSGVIRQEPKQKSATINCPEGKFKCKNKTIKKDAFDKMTKMLLASIESGKIKTFLDPVLNEKKVV